MRVLVACEFSGVVREAFLSRGHDAYSCDILPSNFKRAAPGRHMQQDVKGLLREEWDLVIAHPPCTYLSKIGARWLKHDPMRRVKMYSACDFFLACLNANSPRICVENPIMFLEARKRIGVDPSQKVCPSQFGHPETKSTYLWLKGLPLLQPISEKRKLTTGIPGQRDSTSTMSGRASQVKLLRSITYQGIADAMAEQWGDL